MTSDSVNLPDLSKFGGHNYALVDVTMADGSMLRAVACTFDPVSFEYVADCIEASQAAVIGSLILDYDPHAEVGRGFIWGVYPDSKVCLIKFPGSVEPDRETHNLCHTVVQRYLLETVAVVGAGNAPGSDAIN